jgi:hypothetical protein
MYFPRVEGKMTLMYEEEIRRRLSAKLVQLRGLHSDLVAKAGSELLPVTDVLKALDLVSAAVKDCVVCQENHACGVIPLAAETLGETFLVLREAETVIRDVIAGLLVAADSPFASWAEAAGHASGHSLASEQGAPPQCLPSDGDVSPRNG